MDLPITSLFAALAALMLAVLSFPIALTRRKLQISLGDGGDETLRRRIRTQANFTEYVPLVLIVMALAEITGVGAYWIWILGVLITLGRLAHAYGILKNDLRFRAPGMLLTMASLVLGGLLLLLHRV